MVVNISRLADFNPGNIHIYAHTPASDHKHTSTSTYTKVEPQDYARLLKTSSPPEFVVMYAAGGKNPQTMRLSLKPVNVKFLCEQYTKAKGKKYGNVSAGVWSAGNMIKHMKPVLTIKIGDSLFPEQFGTVSLIISRLNDLISAGSGSGDLALTPLADVYSNSYGFKILRPTLKTYWTAGDNEGDKRSIESTLVRDIKSGKQVIFNIRHNKNTPYTEEDWNGLYAKDIIQEKDGASKPLYSGNVEIEFKSINVSSDSTKSSTLSMTMVKAWLIPKAPQHVDDPLPEDEWDAIEKFNALTCEEPSA